MTAHQHIGILTPDDVAAARRLRGGASWHTVAAIAAEVGALADLSPAEIMGRSRRPLIAEARQIVMFAAHRQGISVPEIARVMVRDVSTVRHGIEAEARRRGWK